MFRNLPFSCQICRVTNQEAFSPLPTCCEDIGGTTAEVEKDASSVWRPGLQASFCTDCLF